ncbi:MAG: PHP domain-containing protein [Actinomycetota bacterium]|nr:PHP domain-containing protein [Actinomycetota bacterium]
MLIDLHTHSSRSDGTDSPRALVGCAAAAGLDVIAITDHDTAAGWDEALEAADEVGVRVVRGLEISCRYRGAGMHLLAYEPAPSHQPLLDELVKVLAGRSMRLPAMLQRLRELGIGITGDDVTAVAADAAATGRPHVADALVALGVVISRDEAFDRYLSPGRPAYVDRYAADLVTMIGLIADAGGVSVIAHPWGRASRRVLSTEAFADLADAGLVGIEVDHNDHSSADRVALRDIAQDLDLVRTGSSDYHGSGKVGHPLGCNTTDVDQYDSLRDRLRAASRTAGTA